jgi:hypothetical protein
MLRRAISFTGAICAVVTCCLCFVPEAVGLTACEAIKPTIEHVRLTKVTLAGVGLEAQINPKGTETAYEFLIVWQSLNPPEGGEPLPGGPLAQGGHIAAGNGDVTVSAVLSGLQPGYTYWYEVVASNLAGKTKSGASPFSYFYSGGYPEGTGSGPPYIPESSPCSIESGNDVAAEMVEDYRKEQQAKEAAKAKAAEEAASKRRVEEERAHSNAPSNAPTSNCVVPSVQGDTLSAARRAIARAHCRLGHVGRSRRYRRALVVTRQNPRRGVRLNNGAAITLTLGPAHRRHPH